MDTQLLQSLLVAAGWLPEGSSPPLVPRPSHDILRTILKHRSRKSTARDDAMTSWLGQAIAARCHVTCEFGLETVGTRLVYWPCGVRLGRRVSIVSSRRAGNDQPEWFRTLAETVGGLDHRRDLLMTSAGTTCFPYLQYLADVENFPHVEICPAEHADPVQWLTWLRHSAPHGGVFHPAAYVSPRIDQPTDNTLVAPERDRLLIGLADVIHVLRVRRNGNLWCLLLRHAKTPNVRGVIQLPAGRDLVSGELAAQLLGAGANRFRHGGSEPPLREPRSWSSQRSNRPGRIIRPLSPSSDRSFLCHWTRRCEGPWPDQSHQQYLQQKFLDPWHDRSALASLRRIIRMQRILATDRLNRDSVRVVAFTERRLGEFAELRVYRPHLRRWDFEPYGICIDARWLQQRGAAPVIYGNDHDWHRMSARQRPFFQPKTANWMEEREWRHVGDVDLSRLTPPQGYIFVPDDKAAASIALYSRWRVVVV